MDTKSSQMSAAAGLGTLSFKGLCEKFASEHPDCETRSFTYMSMQARALQKREGVRRQYALDYVLRQLCRSNVKDFTALHLHCKYRPYGEWGIHRVGPSIRSMVCEFCQACKGPCPGPDAYQGTAIAAVTLDAAYEAGVLDHRTYVALKRTYSSVEELYQECKGHPTRIVKRHPGLSQYGVNNACTICKAYLEGHGLVCPREEEAPPPESSAISDTLVQNISSAFGVSTKDAERALRTGSLEE